VRHGNNKLTTEGVKGQAFIQEPECTLSTSYIPPQTLIYT